MPDMATSPAAMDALLRELVDANRILYHQGVVDGFGHVSVRHPDSADRFLLARSMAPALVTPTDILSFDLEGNAQDGETRAPYLERFIHAAIYRARARTCMRWCTATRPASSRSVWCARLGCGRCVSHERLPASRRAGLRDPRCRGPGQRHADPQSGAWRGARRRPRDARGGADAGTWRHRGGPGPEAGRVSAPSTPK